MVDQTTWKGGTTIWPGTSRSGRKGQRGHDSRDDCTTVGASASMCLPQTIANLQNPSFRWVIKQNQAWVFHTLLQSENLITKKSTVWIEQRSAQCCGIHQIFHTELLLVVESRWKAVESQMLQVSPSGFGDLVPFPPAPPHEGRLLAQPFGRPRAGRRGVVHGSFHRESGDFLIFHRLH